MKISVRTCSSIHGPVVQPYAVRRLRTATGRLAHRLRGVEIDVSRESPREGGRYICSIHGKLARGGSIRITRDEKDVRSAVASSVERFRRSLVRKLERLDRAS